MTMPMATLPCKVTINNDEFPVEVKRLYLPVSIDLVCPTCGTLCNRDFSGDYLSYPNFNTPIEVHVMCHGPDGEDECTEITTMIKLVLDCVPVDPVTETASATSAEYAAHLEEAIRGASKMIRNLRSLDAAWANKIADELLAAVKDPK